MLESLKIADRIASTGGEMRIEAHGYVDVRIRSGVPAGGGTEKRKPDNAGGLQFVFVLAEDCEGGLPIHAVACEKEWYAREDSNL